MESSVVIGFLQFPNETVSGSELGGIGEPVGASEFPKHMMVIVVICCDYYPKLSPSYSIYISNISHVFILFPHVFMISPFHYYLCRVLLKPFSISIS